MPEGTGGPTRSAGPVDARFQRPCRRGWLNAPEQLRRWRGGVHRPRFPPAHREGTIAALTAAQLDEREAAPTFGSAPTATFGITLVTALLIPRE